MKKNLSIEEKSSLWLATLFGVGYVPFMPGTAACVAALPIYMFVHNQLAYLIITAVTIILSYAICTKAEEILEEKDSKKIVIDDFAGMLITFAFVPYNIRYLVIGFFLFRMMDVLKVPPANKIEKCHGAKGIVGDDVVAGIYAVVMLHIVRLFT